MKKLDQKKLDEYLNRTEGAIEREIKLINTFLGATKIQGGQMQFDPTRFSIVELVKQVVSENKPRAVEKGLKLIFQDNVKGIPSINADRVRIGEVIDNLVSNAVKYTQTGQVSVDLEMNKKEQTITISITDTGSGISTDDQKTLFTKFGRVKNYTTEKERMTQIVRPGGTGLGLYLVKGVVELHGGKVGVRSKLGQGSTFYFTLPFEHRISKKNLINPIFSKEGPKNVFEKMKEKPKEIDTEIKTIE